MSFRKVNLFIFLVALFLFGYAIYMQVVLHISPCALCIMQRICLLFVLVLSLAGALQNPATLGRRIYVGCLCFFSLAGLGFAIRQIYLQHLPPGDAVACLPGIGYMLTHMPMTETLKFLFTGTGQCAIVSWEFLGLSTPIWTLIFFLIFTLFSLVSLRLNK